MGAMGITVIEGDGIGPEVTQATLHVLRSCCGDALWFYVAPQDEVDLFRHENSRILIEHIRVRGGIVLKGPTNTPSGGGWRSMNVRLRERLETFVCVRPCRSIPGIASRFQDVNLVIVRENLEGLYAGIGTQLPETNDVLDAIQQLSMTFGTQHFKGRNLRGAALTLSVVTPQACERTIRYAFEYARTHKRKRVTCVHKSNILKETDGLFLRVFQGIAREYDDIVADDILVDNAAQQLVLRPERFDVLVAPNLYGDILSDLGAGLTGGLGVAPGANIGTETAIFEATHGTAPDIAGQGKANPTALLLSACMMLDHLGLPEQATRIRIALMTVIASGSHVTPDIWDYPRLQGQYSRQHFKNPPPIAPATTMEMAQAVVERMTGSA
ncbi:MAG: isocitrate/isopropylmalate family dehydrogenase [bacterium]|nr:isocitrate/isopropylmalate family dehydrogenase [bacterium]